MGNVNTILQAHNTTRVQRGQFDAAVMTQEAFNEREAMSVALKEFSRTLGNQLRQDAAGKEFNEAVSQTAQQLEARSTGRINKSLMAAEKVGALAAAASAQGVGGTSVELLNETVSLQKSIAQQLADQTTERLAGGAARGAAQIMDNAYAQTDLTQAFGSFDHTIHIAPKAMKRRLGKLIGVGVATFFGGPMAGEAVADMAVAEWQASNGNFSGAAANWDSAIANGVKGYQTWSSLQGGDGPSSWFGAVTQKQNQQVAAQADEASSITWGSEQDQGFGFQFGNNWDWF